MREDRKFDMKVCELMKIDKVKVAGRLKKSAQN